MKPKNVTRVSIASRAARAHLQDAIRSASLPPADRDRINREKTIMLTGLRFALRTLGIDRDAMISRFVEQEFQAWVADTEQQVAPPAPQRKQPHRIEGGKGRRQA